VNILLILMSECRERSYRSFAEAESTQKTKGLYFVFIPSPLRSGEIQALDSGLLIRSSC
jgi:hypothetical protein